MDDIPLAHFNQLAQGSGGSRFEVIKYIDTDGTEKRIGLKIGQLDSILDETSILLSISPHPTIIGIPDINNTLISGAEGRLKEGESLLFLDYHQGSQTLYDYINLESRDRELVGEGILIGCDVLRALSYIHGNRIIHRDVKPTNIIVTKDGRSLLCDFSVACPKSEIQKISPKGTAAYAAPENFTDLSALSELVDIYSLGIVVFEIATGMTTADILRSNNTSSFEEMALKLYSYSNCFSVLDNLRNYIPPLLEDFLTTCTAVKPHRRFESTDEALFNLSEKYALYKKMSLQF